MIFDAVKLTPQRKLDKHMLDAILYNYEAMKDNASSAEKRAISAKQELNNYKRSNQSINSDPLGQAIAGLCIDSVMHLVNDLSGELKGETLMQKTREVSFRLLKVGTKVGVGVGVGMLVLEVLAANK